MDSSKSKSAFIIGVISILVFITSIVLFAVMGCSGSVLMSWFPVLLMFGTFVMSIIGIINGIKGVKSDALIAHKVIGFVFNGGVVLIFGLSIFIILLNILIHGI
jgi:hypothetical protein